MKSLLFNLIMVQIITGNYFFIKAENKFFENQSHQILTIKYSNY